jgi:predicted membrane protein
MFKKKQVNTNVIIFSRWSRKGYALFACLKKVVHIARLSFDMGESSVSKKSTIIRICTLLGIDDSENNDIDIKELQLLSVIMPITSINKDIYSQIIISSNTESPYFAQCKVWTFFLIPF